MAAFDDAVAVYEQAEQQDDRQLWLRALETAAKCAKEDPANTNAAYLAGLCAYHLNQPQLVYLRLEEALRRDRNNTFARLYLGHQLFDDGRYADALAHLVQVDGSLFEQMGQRWRHLKLAELVLCCRIYLGNEVSHAEVQQLVQEYQDTPEDEAAMPVELVRCVASIKPEQSASFRAMAGIVIVFSDLLEEQMPNEFGSLRRALAG